MVKFGRISLNLRSNSIEFGLICRIRPNSTFEFGFQNSKNRNSNEFEQTRPSLVFSTAELNKNAWTFALGEKDGRSC